MPLSKHLTGVVVATFLASFAAQAQNQISEFRALWADAWHEGFQSPAEVSNLVSSVRAANCNALFVQVRKRGDAYYAGGPFEPRAGAVKSDLLLRTAQTALARLERLSPPPKCPGRRVRPGGT